MGEWRLPHRKPAVFAAVSIGSIVLSTGAVPAASPSPFTALEGVWGGKGQVRLAENRSEQLVCRAYYNAKSGGAAMTLAIRCASTSYKIELRSNLAHNAGRITGTWEERTYNTGGTITGTATASSIKLAFSGNVMGSLSVSFAGSQQRVAITAANDGSGGPASIYLNLSRNK